MYEVHGSNESPSCEYSQQSSSEGSTPNSKVASRIRNARARATSKIKDAASRIASRIIEEDRNEDDAIANTIADPAFNPTPSEAPHATEDSPSDKVKSTAKSTVKALIHPKRALQAKAKQVTAGEISAIHKANSPSSHTADLLHAYEDLESSLSEGLEASQGRSTPRQVRKKARLQQLDDEGQRRRTAWVTQHVDRVKVVSAHERAYPRRKDYYVKRKDGRVGLDVPRWIGHLTLWYTQGFTAPYVDDFDSTPFDARTFRSHLERLAVATIPLQVWAMNVRSVYRWQNPWRTARWLALWVFFWHFEYVASFFWGSIICYTIKNKLHPRSIEDLRASLQRVGNHETAAFGFDEFIHRHGDNEWLDPMIEQLGPYVQLQLYDLVNLLEALANFYSWQIPRYTIATLFFFASCLALAALTDLRYALKIFWFIVGGAFFFCWPIASLYPRYRILVSPFRWIIWDIPTHAEKSFTYLSQQCQETRPAATTSSATKHATLSETEQHADPTSSSSSFRSATSAIPSSMPSESTLRTSLLSYRSIHNKQPGRLHITPSSIFFTHTLAFGTTGAQAAWIIPYASLVEMRKYAHRRGDENVAKDSRSKHEGSECVLEVVKDGGEVFTLDVRRRGMRDQAFNYILGFSGRVVRWRNLQC